MEDFKNRLLQFIDSQYGVSQRKFEEMCGLGNGTITSIKVKGPSADIVSKISYKCPELNLNWLFRGVGNMLNQETGIKDDNSTSMEVSVVKTAGAVIITDIHSIESIIQVAVDKAIEENKSKNE